MQKHFSETFLHLERRSLKINQGWYIVVLYEINFQTCKSRKAQDRNYAAALPTFIAKAKKKKTTGNYINEIRNGMKALIFYITSSNRNGEVSLGWRDVKRQFFLHPPLHLGAKIKNGCETLGGCVAAIWPTLYTPMHTYMVLDIWSLERLKKYIPTVIL